MHKKPLIFLLPCTTYETFRVSGTNKKIDLKGHYGKLELFMPLCIMLSFAWHEKRLFIVVQ